MIQDDLLRIMAVVRRKQVYDQKKASMKGSQKYFSGLQKEILEVAEELEKDRLCYLEDELGDILWDFLNMTCALESEKNVEIERVFRRCFQKYQERMDALDRGEEWAEIKQVQKKRLETEHLELSP